MHQDRQRVRYEPGSVLRHPTRSEAAARNYGHWPFRVVHLCMTLANMTSLGPMFPKFVYVVGSNQGPWAAGACLSRLGMRGVEVIEKRGAESLLGLRFESRSCINTALGDQLSHIHSKSATSSLHPNIIPSFLPSQASLILTPNFKPRITQEISTRVLPHLHPSVSPSKSLILHLVLV